MNNKARGGLAVGARDADDIELLLGVGIECGAELGVSRPRIVNKELTVKPHILLNHDRSGAVLQRLRRLGVAVKMLALDADKYAAVADLSRIIGDKCYILILRQSL